MSVDSGPTRRSAMAKGAWWCLAASWIAFLIPTPWSGPFCAWPLTAMAVLLAIGAIHRQYGSTGRWPLLAGVIGSPLMSVFGPLFTALVLYAYIVIFHDGSGA